MRLATIVLACLWTVLTATPARADTPAEAETRARAKDRLDEGSALYGRGDYDAALQRYREAFDIFPSPKLYFNMGLASHKLGRLAEAIGYFRRFLAEAIGAAREPRAEAERLLAELQTRVAWLQLEVDREGAAVFLDGKPLAVTPLERTPLDPGPHTVVVRRPPHPPATEPVEATAGETIRLKLHVPDADASGGQPALATAPLAARADLRSAAGVEAATPAAPERPSYRRWWFWTAIGCVVAGGVAALVIARAPSYPEGSLGTDHAGSF